VSIEGYRVYGSAQLTDKLQEMSKVDEMMHPGKRAGRWILAADATAPFEIIRAVMSAGRAAGYTRAMFTVEGSPWALPSRAESMQHR
jgi:hypothetical protein